MPVMQVAAPFATGTPHCGSQQSGDSGEDPICPMATSLQCCRGEYLTRPHRCPMEGPGGKAVTPRSLRTPWKCQRPLVELHPAMHHVYRQQKDEPDGEKSLRLEAGVVKNNRASGMPRKRIATGHSPYLISSDKGFSMDWFPGTFT